MGPSFRAIATLLADIDPQALARLQESFPEHSYLFSPVYVLGSEASEPTNTPPTQEMQALRSFSETGLAVAERTLEQLIAALTRRMKRARSVKLTGAIVASVSSVGVVSALALAQPEAEVIAALLGLISSVATLVGEHMDRPLVGSRKSLGELIGDALSAEGKTRDLRVGLVGGAFGSREAVFTLATKVNEVAATVRAIMVYGGVEAQSPDRAQPALRTVH